MRQFHSLSSHSAAATAAPVVDDVDAACHSADRPVDAVFIVDSSSSVRREDYGLAIGFVADFVGYLGDVSDRWCAFMIECLPHMRQYT